MRVQERERMEREESERDETLRREAEDIAASMKMVT